MSNDFPALPPIVVERTLQRWDETHRGWHTRAHLEQLLADIAADPELTDSDREMLRYVALFHDAIYVPHATDNEEQSARLASLHLASYARRPEVISIIMATKAHQSIDRLAQKFNLWDCAILREDSWERLVEYEDGIAHEYRAVDPQIYRRERSRFLEKAALDFGNPLLSRLARQVAEE